MDVRRYSLVSDQVDHREVEIIIRELEKVLARNVPGGIVEFGCYVGTTSLFIQRFLRGQQYERPFHVYDSFAGLPPKTNADNSPAGDQFITGALSATKATFTKNFRHANVPLPAIHKAWFSDLTAQDLPQQIAFAFLDGDYYASIKDSLRLITPCLSQGARIVVDDYQSEALPGAHKAIDEWLQAHPDFSIRAEHSLAIIA
jgi:O-methyltransferase